MAHGEATKRKLRKSPSRTPTAMFSIPSFCAAHGISQSFFYQLKAEGRGPDVLRLGARVFVTHESAARWRLLNEAKTAGMPASKRQRSCVPPPASGSEM
jgi:hypothetical protein